MDPRRAMRVDPTAKRLAVGFIGGMELFLFELTSPLNHKRSGQLVA